jgi:hypothetical protein
MKTLLTLLLVIITSVVISAAVTLRISPRVQITNGSGYVRLTASIDPDEHNRSYCLIWEGPYSGSQCRSLEGRAAPKTQRLLELKDLPEGHYEAQVVVDRNDGTTVRSSVESWDIYGPDYSPPEMP